MSGSSIKNFRRAKIKKQMKDKQASKVIADALLDMKNMTDEELDEFAKNLAEELGVEDADKDEPIEEEKVDDNDWFMYVLFGCWRWTVKVLF